jgi:tRNA (adenine57-N1/adenine58-N1)-methyltransferase
VTMYETLQRPHDVSPIPTPLNVSEIGEKLKKSELKREQKRLKQIANARAKLRDPDTGVGAKRKRGEDGEGGAGEEVPVDAEVDVADGGVEVGSKRFKPDSDYGGTIQLHAQTDGPPVLPVPPTPAPSRESLPVPALPESLPVPALPESLTGTPSAASPPIGKMIVSKPMAEVRGHTSYLTFACLVPVSAPTGGEGGD